MQATYAEYTNLFNPSEGVIVAANNESPQTVLDNASASGKDSSNESLDPPPLNHWSDVVYLTYKHECESAGKNVRDLRYIMHARSSNKLTRAALLNLLDLGQGETGRSYPTWPHRKVFTAASREGSVLLATPNGIGVAFMLIGHKRELGHKRVKSVTVYVDAVHASVERNRQFPTIIYELEDAGRGGGGSGGGGGRFSMQDKGGISKPRKGKPGGSGGGSARVHG